MMRSTSVEIDDAGNGHRRAGSEFAAVQTLALRVELRLLRVELGLLVDQLGSALCLGLLLGVVVVDQALGLGLEDAQGAAAAPCQIRQLGRAEEQHDDGQDQDELGRTKAAEEQ